MALNPQQIENKYGRYPPLSTGNLDDIFRTGTGKTLQRPANEDLAHGWDARNSMRGDFVQIFQAMERIQRNAALTSGAQVIEVGKMARRRMDDRLVAADTARSALVAMRDRTATRVARAMQPPDPHVASLLPELRGYLRDLPEAKRYDLVAKETQGDHLMTYLYAIAGAPPALSGIVSGRHAELSNILLGIVDPSLLGMVEGFTREIQLLDRAAAKFKEQINDFIDFETAEEWRKLSEREE